MYLDGKILDLPRSRWSDGSILNAHPAANQREALDSHIEAPSPRWSLGGRGRKQIGEVELLLASANDTDHGSAQIRACDPQVSCEEGQQMQTRLELIERNERFDTSPIAEAKGFDRHPAREEIDINVADLDLAAGRGSDLADRHPSNGLREGAERDGDEQK